MTGKMPEKGGKWRGKYIKTSTSKAAKWFWIIAQHSVCSGSLQFPSWITWSNHRVDPLQSLLLCSVFSIFFLYCYYYFGFNTFNQAWIKLWHYEGRSNLENGPFWNIKWTEIAWTRLNLRSYSPSWCTDGQRVIMDSREIIMIFF